MATHLRKVGQMPTFTREEHEAARASLLAAAAADTARFDYPGSEKDGFFNWDKARDHAFAKLDADFAKAFGKAPGRRAA